MGLKLKHVVNNVPAILLQLMRFEHDSLSLKQA